MKYTQAQIERAEKKLKSWRPRLEWWQEVLDSDLSDSPYNLGEHIEGLFRKAKRLGIGGFTAMLIVREAAHAQRFPYDDQKIINHASIVFKKPAKTEFVEEDFLVDRDTNPCSEEIKPIIKPKSPDGDEKP